MNIHEYIKKLQGLSDIKKQIILYGVLGFFGLIMGYFWIQSTKNNLATIAQSIHSSDLPQINLQDTGNGDFSKIKDVVNSANQAVADSNSQTTDSSDNALATADWKNYANAQYGFEIKYPPNFSVKENSLNPDFTSVSFSSDSLHPFWVSSGNNKQKSIVEMTNLIPSDDTEIKNGNLTVNNIGWNTTEQINIPKNGTDTASSVLNVYTQKGNLTYVLQCINCNAGMFGDTGANKRLVFDQMLSTFKFTN